MAESDEPGIPLPPPAAPGLRCPWCSTPVESLEDATCVACGATLHGDTTIEVPGVTAIDSAHATRATVTRRPRRTFGSLFVGGDDGIPPPTEAELPALAMPDPEVRREMLRLQLDAELADLTARAAALAAERGIPAPVIPGVAAGPDASPDAITPAGAAAGDVPALPSSPDAAATAPGPAATAPAPDGAAPVPEATPAPDAVAPRPAARPGRSRAKRPRA